MCRDIIERAPCTREAEISSEGFIVISYYHIIIVFFRGRRAADDDERARRFSRSLSVRSISPTGCRFGCLYARPAAAAPSDQFSDGPENSDRLPTGYHPRSIRMTGVELYALTAQPNGASTDCSLRRPLPKFPFHVSFSRPESRKPT